jgi:hypothetical protein
MTKVELALPKFGPCVQNIHAKRERGYGAVLLQAEDSSGPVNQVEDAVDEFCKTPSA